jgi:hypothetical protein
VIASAHPLEKAQEGMFCNALRSVLFDPSAPRSWSDEDECIHSEFLARAVGKILPSQVSRPQYKADGIGQDFVPNPRYRPGQPAAVVEERASRISSWAGAEHFDLAARGIEVGESGWYFAGRKALLRTLVEWLGSAPHGVRVVTGPPGTGKSAVIGRLATLSDTEFRHAVSKAGVLPLEGDGTVPPEGIIDVAIHAKGKTLNDCARAVARALKISTRNEVAVELGAVLAAIERIDRRVTIVIDGLDEAASGQGQIIATRLIAPLGQLNHVRVLVGSRRSLDGTVVPAGEDRHGRLRAAFGIDALIDDLEDEQDTREDIAEYVRLVRRRRPSRRKDRTCRSKRGWSSGCCTAAQTVRSTFRASAIRCIFCSSRSVGNPTAIRSASMYRSPSPKVLSPISRAFPASSGRYFGPTATTPIQPSCTIGCTGDRIQTAKQRMRFSGLACRISLSTG